jgi:hypothetical protein
MVHGTFRLTEEAAAELDVVSRSPDEILTDRDAKAP